MSHLILVPLIFYCILLETFSKDFKIYPDGFSIELIVTGKAYV